VLPGTGGSPIDLNFFNGSLDELKAWCGLAPVEEEPMGELSLAEQVRLLWEMHPELHAGFMVSPGGLRNTHFDTNT
jgi:hypothetical protein